MEQMIENCTFGHPFEGRAHWIFDGRSFSEMCPKHAEAYKEKPPEDTCAYSYTCGEEPEYVVSGVLQSDGDELHEFVVVVCRAHKAVLTSKGEAFRNNLTYHLLPSKLAKFMPS